MATMASPRPLEGEALERTSFSSLFTKVRPRVCVGWELGIQGCGGIPAAVLTEEGLD